MSAIIEKLRDLEYNELLVLGLVEQDDDLREIFQGEINMPFSILYRLQKEGKLNDTTRELLVTIFQMVILTKKELIDKYLRLASNDGKIINSTIPVTPIEVIEAITEVVEVVEEPINIVTKEKVTSKKESNIPRRYGKEKITTDIKAQGGKATPLQRAMLKGNTLKNLYVNLNNRLIKDYLTEINCLNEQEYRKIISAIETVEQIIKPIIKNSRKN